jgi:hypothetical protein
VCTEVKDRFRSTKAANPFFMPGEFEEIECSNDVTASTADRSKVNAK